jgi:hypothetical protein
MGYGMSKFRFDETENFPVERTDRKVWYAIIGYDQECGFSKTSFASSKSGKLSLITMISELSKHKRKFTVVGIWQGDWSTDLFVLDEIKIVKMLRKEIK